jgi:flavin-dependent dehydrogenase
MRTSARAVVIGGGVGGASILYWLTKHGWDDVVLLERAELTSGSTFHSAGLVGQLRGSLGLTKMMMRSVELYRTLEDEVGMPTGWHEVGSLRLASSAERMEELHRQAAQVHFVALHQWLEGHAMTVSTNFSSLNPSMFCRRVVVHIVTAKTVSSLLSLQNDITNVPNHVAVSRIQAVVVGL